MIAHPERVMRRFILAALLGLSVLACDQAGPTPNPSGILFVAPGEAVQARFSGEAMAQAHSDATVLAENNGLDLGYPWIDPATGELVLSAVTAQGRELIQRANITVPHRIREVAHGATELRRIQDDATFLRSRGVPGAELIFETLPDQRDNRALIVIRAMSQGLIDYLVAHYPPDAIAIEVNPNGP